MLLHLKRHAEALGEYARLIARHPENPHAYTGRAFAHQMIGDEDAADADFDQLTRLVPEKSQELEVQALVGKIHSLESQDRYQEAIQVAQQIIDLAPDDPTGYHMRAWIYWYTEQLVEAYDDYSRLLEMKPDDPGVLNSRGQVQAEMGDFSAALTDLDAAVDQSRQAGQHHLLAYALNGRAFALAGLGRMEESTRDYEESVRLCPANAWAHYNRAVVMSGWGEQAAARKLFERALASNAPPLTKRKRERAQSLLSELDAD